MTGLAQAGLFTMAQVWNLPGPARPGYPQRLGRAALFLGVLGVGVLVTMLLTGLSIYGHHALALAVLLEVLAVLFEVLAVAASIGMYVIGFRVLTPKGGPASWCLARSPEASHAVLQASGTYLVHHFLHGDPVYGVSARCSGLVAWICLCAEITVYAAEINAVLAPRLWPRGKIQPFTEADRVGMALQVLQNQRRDVQHAEVSFDGRPADVPASGRTPRTPGETAPPAQSRAAGGSDQPPWNASRAR
jgi:hypothetical protein